MMGALLAIFLAAAPAERAYAVVVGNNTPPSGSGLATLQYADDDAVRFYDFFRRFAADVRLLAVLDDSTRRRHQELPAAAEVPTLVSLDHALAGVAERMAEDRRNGLSPVFYFVFSGHGALDEHGDAALAFLDGGVNHDQLYERIAALPARVVHLIVDACHAADVVGLRGASELQAPSTRIDPDAAARLFAPVGADRYPNVGALVATTRGQEAHEWSVIESGVFTHELLSALHGAADVNLDGRIEYSEVQAFIASANREITDPRAIPHVLMRAPPVDRNAALARLTGLRDSAYLRGDSTRLGHFHVELAGGERYLDANVRGRATLAVPSNVALFVRGAGGEAEVRLAEGAALELAALELHPSASLAARGSIDASHRLDLFAVPYDAAYYRGFVDSQGLASVAWTEPALSFEVGAPPPRPAALAALALAGLSAAAGIATGAVAWDARRDFSRTHIQGEAHAASERYVTYGNVTLGAAAVAALAGAAAFWLWGEPPAAE